MHGGLVGGVNNAPLFVSCHEYYFLYQIWIFILTFLRKLLLMQSWKLLAWMSAINYVFTHIRNRLQISFLMLSKLINVYFSWDY